MTRPQTTRGARTSCRCGWQSKPTTPGMAARSLRRHSCDLHRRRADRAARVQARADDPGVQRDCDHRRTAHKHGERACYVLDRCRCQPCRQANRTAEAHRHRETAYGRWQPYIPAQPVRDHLTWLGLNNVGLKRIAVLSGVSAATLSKLLYGKVQADGTRRLTARVRPATQAAILAVHPGLDAVADGMTVDGTGTRRRLQALVAVGYSVESLGRLLGTSCPHPIVHGTVVRASTARRVAALYDRLWNAPPSEVGHRQKISVNRSRRYAREHGWPPPLAWDDEALDDPCALPYDEADDAAAMAAREQAS